MRQGLMWGVNVSALSGERISWLSGKYSVCVTVLKHFVSWGVSRQLLLPASCSFCVHYPILSILQSLADSPNNCLCWGIAQKLAIIQRSPNSVDGQHSPDLAPSPFLAATCQPACQFVCSGPPFLLLVLKCVPCIPIFVFFPLPPLS